jgi:Ca2+-binding RTX toxin-like protein
MVSIVLGSTAKNYNFDVSDVDLDTLKGTDPDYSIEGAGKIVAAESKTEYVTLVGDFNLMKMMTGDFESGIRELNGITVVENGRVSYTATGLDMDGTELANGSVFQSFLQDQGYAIRGNTYANVITSADHNDTVHGLGGNDTIYGLGGVDKLYGDIGVDRLDGGEGNDTLCGGTSADVFEFTVSSGDDVILDFQARGRGQDHIDLSGYVDVSSFADLDISRVGKSVLVEFGDDSVLLRGVALKDIDAHDFQF